MKGSKQPASAELLAFGQAIRRRRNEAGMTLDELAEVAAVNRGMLIAIEHGTRNPGLLSVLRIASALRIRPGRLLDEATPDEDV